jgi:hypothetical protein
MLRLVLSLLICVPAFAMLGAKLMANKGHAPLPGLILGVVAGAFFGLMFGGNRKWKVWKWLFGSEGPEE